MIIKNLVKEITHNTGRIFIVGDLHGCYDEFIQNLDDVGFNFDEDLCLSVGDLVDRGDKSLDCFNLIYKSWFKAVRGNHEQFCADYITYSNDDVDGGLREFHESNGGAWFYKLPIDVMKNIADDVLDLPVALIVNHMDKKYLILHGDMPSTVKNLDELVDVLNSSNQEMYMNTILMGRRLINHISRVGHVDAFFGVDKVFFGHTVIPNVVVKENYVFLDTGAVFKNEYDFCRLTMMEIK